MTIFKDKFKDFKYKIMNYNMLQENIIIIMFIDQMNQTHNKLSKCREIHKEMFISSQMNNFIKQQTNNFSISK